MRSKSFLATALVTLAACADTPVPEDTVDGAGGKADGALPTVTFDDGWRETADAPLVAGLRMRIAYDVDRLTACRGSTNGSDVWGITGYAKFDNAEPKAFEVTRLVNGRAVAVQAELEIPARAARVQFWFQNSNRWGCSAYDSNDSANYSFDIEARPEVAYAAFTADGAEDLPRTVRAGNTLLVHYEPERLAECAGSTAGNPAWGVTMSYQVDGGAVKTLAVARAQGTTLVPSDPEITLPRGRDLAIWFEASNRWGCHAYDSNNSANYHIAIE